LLPVNTLTAQNDNDTPVLELGKPIERQLAGGQSHSYRIALVSGQYLHMMVEQRGIDVVLTLFGPNGKKIVEVDSPNGTQGPEVVQLITEVSGVHRLEVRSLEKSAAPGRYEIRIEQLRTAMDRDRNLVASHRAMGEADRLYAEGNAESLRKAMGKLKEALALFRAIGERSGEAAALNGLGSISIDLGENREALEYYNQALSISRAVGDQQGEMSTLNGIAGVYSMLREKRRALDFFNQTLQLVKPLGDRAGEGTLLGNIGDVYKDLNENRHGAHERFLGAVVVTHL
jgi:tetratricopeptide (TPR) repeat protein